MATRKWVSSAVGVYRLLLEQQSSGPAAAAARQLWQAEVSLALPAAAASSAGASTAAVRQHSAARLRTWLPAAAAPLQQLGAAALHSGSTQLQSIHHDSVKSSLTQPPPLAKVAPWEGQLPHKHLPPGHHPRGGQAAAAQYEAADAGTVPPRPRRSLPAASWCVLCRKAEGVCGAERRREQQECRLPASSLPPADPVLPCCTA